MPSPDVPQDPDASPERPDAPPARPLTPKQYRFAEEYLVDLNASAAARRAGYSAHSASVIGYELLQKPAVADLIAQLKKERSERLKCSADRVLEELATVAFSDIRHYGVNRNGQLRRTPGAPHEASRAVQSMKQKYELLETTTDSADDGTETIETIRNATVELKLYDKVRTLELIGKHLGMFVEHVDHTTGGLPVAFTLALGEKGARVIG
jgi:phage terminase small subunit